MKTLCLLLLLFPCVASAADALELLQQALKSLESLDKAGAERLLTAAIAKEPRLTQAYLARGRLRVHMGKLEGAARDTERACRLGEDLWRDAAEMYGKANAHDAEAYAYGEAWKRDGKLENLVGMAEARASAGELEEALAAFNEILRNVDGTGAVRYLAERGRIKSALGLHDEGLADLDLAIKRIPRYSRAYQLRGRIKIRLGRVKEGLADHALAVDQLASHPSSYFILGLAQYDTGDWSGAVQSLSRSVGFGRQVHDYAHLYLFLARCRTGQPAKRMQASRELMKFIEGRPEGDDWLAKVGAYLTGALDEKSLLAEAEKGNKHTRRKHLCEAHAYVAARYMIAGDPINARAHFRKALDTNVTSYVEYNTAHAELARAGRLARQIRRK